jgi:hypothetical protein
VPIIALIVATGAAAVAIDMATMTLLAIRERVFGVVGSPEQNVGELPDESDMEAYRARMTR